MKGQVGLMAHERSHQRDEEFGKSAAPGVRRRKRVPRKDKGMPINWDEYQTCSSCGKAVSKKYIEKHERKHIEPKKEKTLICDHCGKLFAEKTYVLTHIRTQHKKIRDFNCHLCERSFGEFSHFPIFLTSFVIFVVVK